MMCISALNFALRRRPGSGLSANAPANTGAPTITPATGAVAGNDLVGAVGTWDWKGVAQGSPAFNIRWERGGVDLNFGGLTYPAASVTPGSYQMFVQAINANGEKSPWVASNVSVVIGVPDAITAADFTVVAPANTQGDVLDLTVSTAPASNGAAITAAEYTLDGGTTPVALPFVSTGTYQIPGLTPNTAYSGQVRHQNSVGWGPWSPANSATPVDQVAPTVGSVSIDQTNNEIVLSGVSEGGTVFIGIDQSAGAQAGSTIKTGVQASTYLAQAAVVAASGGTATVSVDLSGLTLTADYYVHAVVEDADAAGLFSTDSPVVFTYNAGDTTNPTLASSTPADNATGVALASDIVLTFSENVQFGTGSIVLKNVTDAATVESFDVAAGTGGGGGSITVAGTDLTINPGADLIAGKTYAISTIPTGAIQDAAGNSFLGWTNDDTALNFDTAAASGSPFVNSAVVVNDRATNKTAYSGSYTVTTGNLLVVWISAYMAASSSTEGASAVTYDGQPLTKVGTAQSSGKNWVEAWYIQNPPTGANTLSITVNAPSHKGVAVIVEEYNAAAASPVGASAFDTAITTNTTKTAALTTTAANSLISAGLSIEGGNKGTPAVGAGETLTGAGVTGSTGFSDMGFAAGTEQIPVAGAADIVFMWTTSTKAISGAFEIKV